MFPFRLQKLMDLRKLARDRRRAELGQAYEAQQMLQRQVTDILRQQNQLKQQRRQAAQPGAIEVDPMLGAHRYELVLKGQLQMLQQRAGQVAEEIERRRQRLMEAEREFRVMEKLRERQRSCHQRASERQESRRLDELAVMRARRTEDV